MQANQATLLVESDPRARALVRGWIGGARALPPCREADGIEQARAHLEGARAAAVFGAVELRDGSMFDLLGDLDAGSPVVLFSTSPAQAVRAYDVGACDFLVKPLREDRFRLAVRRVADGLEPPGARPHNPSGRVVVRVDGGERVVDLRELVAVVAAGENYTEVRCASGASLEARRPIKDWERTLPSDWFVRAHRSTIVNIAHVERFDQRGPPRVRLRLRASSLELPVSRRMAPALRRALNRQVGAGV